MTEQSYWHKQGDEPLFPDLLWSRPENRQHAGKLLIIGGNLHGFAAPASAFQEAMQAGAGVAHVLLPDALQKTVGSILENGEFAPSTPSGSFNRLALTEWLQHANWADTVLLAGDLGRNSETAVTAETFVQKYPGPLVITKDAIDYFYLTSTQVLNRPDTTLVLTLAQLQKLARATRWTKPVTFNMGLAQLAEWLHDFSASHVANIVTYHNEVIFAAVKGQVSTTTVGEKEVWRVPVAAHAAVWLMQNPSKPFEAISLAVFETKK